ncbi:hypothetical protein HUJ04_004163 [Dendroctonus ponderosae]|nr:hypothetical protein HUJ04_004163 [Dendroctonus ponderosae]
MNGSFISLLCKRLLTSFIWVNKLHSVPPCDVAKVFSREYGIFVIWKDKNAIANINETVFLAYFQELIHAHCTIT